MSVYNNNIKIMNFISFLNNNEERFGIVFNNKVTDLTGQINNIKSLKELTLIFSLMILNLYKCE